MTSQTADAVPVGETVISAIGTLPLLGPNVVLVTDGKKPPGALPFDVDSPLTSRPYPTGETLLAVLPPATGGAVTGFALLLTFVVETKRRTPAGMLLKLALRRVPKSARPA